MGILTKLRASADDIVQTPDGPTYRARVSGPGEEPWPPVEEQTVILSTHGVQLDYRDFVEMEIGEFNNRSNTFFHRQRLAIYCNAQVTFHRIVQWSKGLGCLLAM